jgi:hypothetical protein
LWSLSWARSNQSISSHPVSPRSNLILSTHLRLRLPSGLFLSVFPTKILYAFFCPHSCYMSYASHLPWLDHSNYTWRRAQVMKFLIMQYSLTSCHFIPLRSNYSPQLPVLKYPQFMFFSLCQGSSFTPIQNHMQNHTARAVPMSRQ